MATVGLRPIISRDVETIGVRKLNQMHTLPERLYKDIERVVNGEEPEYSVTYYDYRETLKDLYQDWDIEQVQKMVDQFPDDFQVAGSALFIRSQEIIQLMIKEYPATMYQTVVGKDRLAPNDTRMFKFINVLEMLDQPECLPYYIHCGGLLQSQVKAMRAVYPTMSEFVDAALFQAITKARANDDNFQLNVATEHGVKAFWGRPPVSDQSLAKAQMAAKSSTMKKEHQEQQANPPSRQRTSDSPDATALTKAEAASG